MQHEIISLQSTFNIAKAVLSTLQVRATTGIGCSFLFKDYLAK